MRVGRREFAWVFPQLSLVGQTSSESWRESFFLRFLCFCSLLPRFFFFVFLTLVKPADSPSHYSNSCRWYVIIFSCFLLLLMGNDFWNSLRLSCNSHDRSNLSLTLIKIWTSSKLLRVHESWQSNESESWDSSSFDQALRLFRKSAQKVRLCAKLKSGGICSHTPGSGRKRKTTFRSDSFISKSSKSGTPDQKTASW